MFRRVIVLVTAAAAAGWGLPAPAVNIASHPELGRFIDEMVARNGLSRKVLTELFSQVRLRREVIQAIERPAERQPWYRYRRLFVNAATIRQGVAYWHRHRPVLERAAETYGVPPEIILAILGVESRFGRISGDYPVLDSLTTLTLLYPRRATFFRRELEQFLLLAREEGFDPAGVKGSYAGAIGDPQFIASSYRRYAIDFDGDQRRDLVDSAADVIGSVANYFRDHGWVEGGPVMSRVRLAAGAETGLANHGTRPTLSVKRFRQAGILPTDEGIDGSEMAALLRVEDADGDLYLLGFHNFHVITRYNRSVHYALAVYELSRRLRQAYAKHA